MLLTRVLVDESTVTHIKVPFSTVFRLVGSGDLSELIRGVPREWESYKP